MGRNDLVQRHVGPLAASAAAFDACGATGRIKLRVIRAFLAHEYGGAIRNFDKDLALHIADLTGRRPYETPGAALFGTPVHQRHMSDESDINVRNFVRIMAAVGERIRVAKRRTEVQRFFPGVASTKTSQSE